ncbi:MAG: DUF5615 family PIN-like protein [Microscillaceae bacterium]|nr:DUF5615 family PIN-like protein [Microscillaceae bacterium]
MKILLDQNISYHAIKKLATCYEEVAQVGRLGMAQTDDAMIWQYARTHGYVLVTFDAYFKERNILSGHPIKIILLRFENASPDFVIKTLKSQASIIQDFFTNENLACLELHE